MITLAYLLLWAATLVYVAHVTIGRRWVGQMATGTTVVSWGLATAGLVQRGLATGHWPLTNRYEFALCFAWAILAVYLLLEASWRADDGCPQRQAGPFVLAVALLVATYAVTRPATDRAIAPLLPALRSVWLQVHVLTATVGYAAFGVAAGLGVMQLVHRAGDGRWPAAEEVGRTMDRAIGLGFPWLTLGIVTGAIWAQNAWGRYWGWDPKENWALITWLIYTLFLHLRAVRGWRGRPVAVLSIVGFAVVLFTFLGVGWLARRVGLESLHVY